MHAKLIANFLLDMKKNDLDELFLLTISCFATNLES